MRMCRKLRGVVGDENGYERNSKVDLAKAAEMHREIEVVYEEQGLNGISVIEEEFKWLSGIGNWLRSQAMDTVEKGMDESNQNDIWCGLQVTSNIKNIIFFATNISLITVVVYELVDAYEHIPRNRLFYKTYIN